MKSRSSAVSLALCFVSYVCLVADAGVAEAQNTPIPAGATIPPWPKPSPQPSSQKAASARSKDLELIHSPAAPGAFDVHVAGEPFALGRSGPMIGYVAR